ncbi:Myosin-binding protein 7 [Linum perenne]
MDLGLAAPFAPPSPREWGICCSCGCGRCTKGSSSSSGGSWTRSVKRKYDEFEGKPFLIPGFDLVLNPRVEIENEIVALRETVSSQQQAIQDLYAELEEERNAASSAASEAMSMILRLQREKAEVQMDARQFKRFAEEKMAHDQEELVSFEDLLYKKDQVIQSLTCEAQAYKHRMMSFGLNESEVDGGFSRNQSFSGSQSEFPDYEYPPLKCNLNENQAAVEGGEEEEQEQEQVVDVEKYAFGETPRSRNGETPRGGRDHLKTLEYRIHQMERSPSSHHTDEVSSGKHVLEKVIVGQSPRKTRHNRILSVESPRSFKAPESPLYKFPNSFKKADYVTHPVEHKYPKKADNVSEFEDEMDDRVYTIDSVHNGVADHKTAGGGGDDDYVASPIMDEFDQPDLNDPDIKTLYSRLHALEADRESMRQALISMRTDKAQLVLLKEIAQQLCKDASPERRSPIKKPSVAGSLKLASVIKCVTSFAFWRKRARQSRFGPGTNDAGLLMLLDQGSRARQNWRLLSRTHL